MRIACVAWALCWLITSPDWPFYSFALLFIQFLLPWVSWVAAWLTSASKDTLAEAHINHWFLPIKICSRSPVQAGGRSTGWHKLFCSCSRTTFFLLWDCQPPAQSNQYQEIRCNLSMNISTLWDMSWSMHFDVFLEEQKVWNQSIVWFPAHRQFLTFEGHFIPANLLDSWICGKIESCVSFKEIFLICWQNWELNGFTKSRKGSELKQDNHVCAGKTCFSAKLILLSLFHLNFPN